VIPAFDGWESLLNASFAPGTQVTGKVVKAEVFGVFVWLGPGRVGMVPRVWSGSGDGAGFESRFVQGTELPVEVVDVAEGGKRIRLSVVGVDREAAEAARAAALRPRVAPPEQRPSPERRPSLERRPAPERTRRREDVPSAAPTSDPGSGFGSHLGEALRAALKRDA
jgi:predicted RNA-binding protein with RPS1 domain